MLGRLSGSAVEHLLSAQVVILGFWDQVQPQVPCREPASPSLSLPLCVCVSLLSG